MALSLSLSLPPFYSKFTIRILRTNECHVFAQMVILKNDNDPAGSRLSCNFSLARDVLVLSINASDESSFRERKFCNCRMYS